MQKRLNLFRFETDFDNMGLNLVLIEVVIEAKKSLRNG